MGTSFTYTVASLMHPPNTDRLWTGQNASGFPNYDRVDVDLTPYAGTLDAQIRFRLLIDEAAAEPGGWYVDDVRVDDMVTFDACASGCVDPPNADLSNALGCTSTTSSTVVLLDGSASTAGAAGFAADLGSVFTHDGPGSFAGRRWATGSQVSLEFPPGTPAGDYPVTLTIRGADGCADAATAVVQLRDELSVPRHDLNTILSTRDYRQNGAWVIAVQALPSAPRGGSRSFSRRRKSARLPSPQSAT